MPQLPGMDFVLCFFEPATQAKYPHDQRGNQVYPLLIYDLDLPRRLIHRDGSP